MQPIDIVADSACVTGENPLWHPREQRLYWVDIPAGRLYRFDPVSRRHEVCYEDRPVGGFTLQADGALLLLRDRGNVVRFQRNRITDTIIEAIPGLETSRFNDVIADPGGRVFAGTMSSGAGANGTLFRIDHDGSWQVLSTGHRTPNGMGFSGNREGMYFTDSGMRRIYRFAYTAGDGGLHDPAIFTETSEADAAVIGRSDGMTVDSADHIWSARWDGARIVRYDPAGRIVQQILMPARKISSLTFGGNDLSDLYATSAGGDCRNPEDPHAGALFRLRPGVRGRPEFCSCIGLKT